MPVLERVLDRDPVLGQDPAPEQALRALVQAAQAWVLDQGQVLVREALGLVARMDRMATDLVMEPAMVVLVLQTVPAMAQAMARVRADMDPAPAASKSTPFTLL
jgi:hypothetical protein